MKVVMNPCLLSAIFAAAVIHYVKSQGGGLSFLCSNYESLKKVDMETQEYTTIVTNITTVAIDYHYKKGLVFWISVHDEKIYSFSFGSNGPITEIVDVCVRPNGVAIDWIHDNLYWTDTIKEVIGVARLDGSLVTSLIDKNVEFPHDIAVDPLEGLLFWMDIGRNAHIERSGMDGSHRAVLVSRGINTPLHLSIDLISHAIYWSDSEYNKIFTCNYNGTNVRVIIAYYSTQLDVLGDWLYFIVWTLFESSLYKIDKHGVGTKALITDGKDWKSVHDFKVYSDSKQIPGVNRCVNNGGCSHLCLPAPLGLVEGDLKHTCVCPDNVLPSDNCSTIPKVTASSDNYKNGQSNTKNSFPIGTIIGISFGLIILALIVFYLYKRFSKRSGQ